MRLPALRSLTAALLVGLTTAVVGAGATVEPVEAASTVEPMRVMTYNIRAGVSEADFEAAVTAAKPLADVIGLQEIGQTAKHLYLRTDADWGYYRPPALQQNPVIWRRDVFDFVDARGVKIAEERALGSEYPSGSHRATYATVVRLRVRSTGQQVAFVNVHLLHGATRSAQPVPSKPLSFALYSEQVDGMTALLRDEAGGYGNAAVYGLGDLNAGYEQDERRQHPNLPFHRFTGIGLTGMWKDSRYLTTSYGTRGTALLDQVWSSRAPRSTSIVTTIKQSDHFPAVAAYDPPPAAAGYVAPRGTSGFPDTAVTSTESWRNGRAPYLDIDLVGDLRYGYAHVELDRAASTAVEGQDFTFDPSGWQDESDGLRRISLRVLRDNTTEGDEKVVLHLVDPVNSSLLARQTITATIVANRS